MHSQLDLDGCFACIWLSSEAEAAMEMSSNGMEKKCQYNFKLPMGLENEDLNQKSKVSVAVFSLKKSYTISVSQMRAEAINSIVSAG